MVCWSGFAPQLLPEETCRWIVSGWSPAVTTLIRAPMAGPVRSLADQLDGQPVVPLTRVLEQDIVVFVAVDSPPISMKMSMSPSRSQSAQETPCPF